ncbi:MAG TPA: effector-associated domain EAD1-containing protein [Chloroflexia bacterium]|jgi:hypothetical protein
MSQLQPREYQAAQDALLDAFPSVPSLTQMVKYALGLNLASEVDISQALKYVVYYLLQYTESRDKSIKLISGAREANPTNEKLLRLASQFGVAPKTDALERYIVQSNPSVNVSAWRKNEGQVEANVCRIKVVTNQGVSWSSGFLVGPDVIITNYHVVEPLILVTEGKSSPFGSQIKWQDVVVQFDYKSASNGEVTNTGREVRLASDGPWQLDSSPYSPLDKQVNDLNTPRQPDHLDYALLRLSARVADDLIGVGPDAVPRGWLTPNPDYDFNTNSPLIIMHHPLGKPMEIAGDAIIGRNSNQTRVRYRTNTEHGSSGAPCFNFSWDLIALHHSGDPNYAPLYHPEYNEGIPFAAILQLMEQRGTIKYLGAGAA